MILLFGCRMMMMMLMMGRMRKKRVTEAPKDGILLLDMKSFFLRIVADGPTVDDCVSSPHIPSEDTSRRRKERRRDWNKKASLVLCRIFERILLTVLCVSCSFPFLSLYEIMMLMMMPLFFSSVCHLLL